MSGYTRWQRVMDDRRARYIVFLTFLVLVLDQLTKYFVISTLPLYASHVVIKDFFSLVHIQNRGAAFGFLNRTDIDWQFWVFAAATVFAVGMIISLARAAHERDTWQIVGLGLILGGALGNFIDRVRMRAVTDFLDFSVGQWHWPAFNVADMAICIGAFCVCVSMFRAHKYSAT